MTAEKQRIWPVEKSYERSVPINGAAGAFWENRGDRRHAGVDIYAPEGADVRSPEAGVILSVEEFTNPQKVNYWNVTYSVVLRTGEGYILRFAEMGEATVTAGQSVSPGDLIGRVGLVLNIARIDQKAPEYIQAIKKVGSPSMLHFEMRSQWPLDENHYLGGNYFENYRPNDLMDPTGYLQAVSEES